ncbi:MAG: hypothetical protein IKZ49_02990 [Alphaproteobacteria bacterium]|nr:hypothetical protein [Alphaproteobacteria bacterium]
MNSENTKILQNPYDEYKTPEEKKRAYDLACDNNEYAIDEEIRHIPLKNIDISKVAFVGGCWRVQRDFPYEITKVRDKNMVITKKLDYTERMPFVYYEAKEVCCNCNGFFIFSGGFDYIVARYDTKKGVYWGYGKTIEAARAFLGLKLFDEYSEMINEVLCGKLQTKQRKYFLILLAVYDKIRTLFKKHKPRRKQHGIIERNTNRKKFIDCFCR